MKQYIKETLFVLAIGFIFTAYPTIIFGQKAETFAKIEKFEKFETYIKISTTDDIDSAYNKIKTLVKNYGFETDSADISQHYFNTQFTQINNSTFKTKVILRLKEENQSTKIFIKGEMTFSKFTKTPIFPATKNSMNKMALRKGINDRYKFTSENNHSVGDPFTACFAQLFEIADQYQNGIISAGGRSKFELDRDVPIGTNEIRIQTGLSKKENFNLLKETFAAYSVKYFQPNKKYNQTYLKTEPYYVGFPGGALPVIWEEDEPKNFWFTVTAMESSISIVGDAYIPGEWPLKVLGTERIRIENREEISKKFPVKLVFYSLIELADHFYPYPLTFNHPFGF